MNSNWSPFVDTRSQRDTIYQSTNMIDIYTPDAPQPLKELPKSPRYQSSVYESSSASRNPNYQTRDRAAKFTLERSWLHSTSETKHIIEYS